MLIIASNYSTPIPTVWEMDGYLFMKTCGIILEDARKETEPKVLSADSLQTIGRMMEGKVGC